MDNESFAIIHFILSLEQSNLTNLAMIYILIDANCCQAFYSLKKLINIRGTLGLSLYGLIDIPGTDL